jgi:hypothetical protein
MKLTCQLLVLGCWELELEDGQSANLPVTVKSTALWLQKSENVKNGFFAGC